MLRLAGTEGAGCAGDPEASDYVGTFLTFHDQDGVGRRNRVAPIQWPGLGRGLQDKAAVKGIGGAVALAVRSLDPEHDQIRLPGPRVRVEVLADDPPRQGLADAVQVREGFFPAGPGSAPGRRSAGLHFGAGGQQDLRQRLARGPGPDVEDVAPEGTLGRLTLEPPDAVFLKDPGAGMAVRVERADDRVALDRPAGGFQLANQRVTALSFKLQIHQSFPSPTGSRSGAAACSSVGYQSSSPGLGSGTAGISSSHRP